VPRPATAEPPSTAASSVADSPCLRLTLNRGVVPWLAPVALLVAFVLTFFPWVGVYPNGTPVYTQSAWRAATGSLPPPDPIGDEVMQLEPALLKHKSVSLLLLFYLILLIPAVLLAVAERLIPLTGGTVPDVFRTVWTYRQTIQAWLSAVLFLLLVGAATFGIGLESAAAAAAEEAVPMPPAAEGTTPSSREIQVRNVKRDVKLASYALDRTIWMTLAVIMHVVAVTGTALDQWLDRNPGRPAPRVECYC
jgi:hypothetical protein